MDGMNIHGHTSDLTVVGLGNNDLDDYVARPRRRWPHRQGRSGAGARGYYRSDHFPFAKQGVPASTRAAARLSVTGRLRRQDSRAVHVEALPSAL
jgi:hypothetical protein